MSKHWKVVPVEPTQEMIQAAIDADSLFGNWPTVVLHLWRKSGTNEFCERPPQYMV